MQFARKGFPLDRVFWNKWLASPDETPYQPAHRDRDMFKKLQDKTCADNRRHARRSEIRTGDQVLL